MSKQSNFGRKLSVNSPERKPSVFERLGTKSNISSAKNVCRSWAQNGSCPLNKQCKLAHTHVLINLSKRTKSDAMKKSAVHKKYKEDHKKSLRSHQSSELEWDGWELRDLEDADENVLEKRKQELERALQLHLKKEKELTRKKDKKVEKKRAASSSSSSSTTTESSSSSTSSTTSSSEPRKKSGRKRKHSTSSSDSGKNSQKRKKTLKVTKGKVSSIRKPSEKKDSRILSDSKNKNVVQGKKTVQKKSYSPSWEKSRGRSPIKQSVSKKMSPHPSPESKNKSSSPRYDKGVVKSKRSYSPKSKAKEQSPKRATRKIKDSVGHAKEKSRQSPLKTRNSPVKIHKASPSRSRRHEDAPDKRRGHYDERKHSPRRERSREKDRKRDARSGRNNDDDNGGLKKGGKILPLKPTSHGKDSDSKKDQKILDKNTDLKSKEDDIEKDRNKIDRDKDKIEKEKNMKCDRDRLKHKKSSDEHDRRVTREREGERGGNRGREERIRDRESDRVRFGKERESERQKEREEALERCRERQRERERIEKERKEKDDKKHQRDNVDGKTKDYDRELPSLLDLKAENPSRNSVDSSNAKNSDKHISRDLRRNVDKNNEKITNQDREGRDRVTPDRNHERRDSKRIEENERRQIDKDYDTRRNRETDSRNCSEIRRKEDGDSRRQWDDARRPAEPVHDRRRPLDSVSCERRQHLGITRRLIDDPYRRGRTGEGDMDSRDFPAEDRRGRKILHGTSDWDIKDQNIEYKDSEGREEWSHSDRHHGWNSRYDHKWVDREENREPGWNHYSRRQQTHEDWSGEWSQEQNRTIFSNEGTPNERFTGEENGKKERPSEKNKENEGVGCEDSSLHKEKSQKGDALSDISDDPDDILNRDDEPIEKDILKNVTQVTNQQIYVGTNEFIFDQRRPLVECLGERSLDFEEISDEELEEEARVSKGIVDVLGADWAGLVQETRPKPRRLDGCGSAHRRWKLKTLISNLGVLSKYAGKEFAEQLITDEVSFSAGLEGAENKFEEILDAGVKINGYNEDTKLEVVEKENTKEDSFNSQCMKASDSLISIPIIHNTTDQNQTTKSALFLSHNRFKRALSARTDLSLRRQLCDLPSKESLHFTLPLDSKMYEVTVQQFQTAQTTAAV